MYKDFITQIQKPSYSAVESMHQTLNRLYVTVIFDFRYWFGHMGVSEYLFIYHVLVQVL